VQWVDSAGKTQPFVQTPGTYMQPALSPDGLRVAVVLTSGRDQDLWLYDSQRETGLRLTFDGSGKSHPVWTPDGAYIVYGGSNGMFWVHSDGSSKAPQTFTNSKVLQTPFSITPDGKRLSFQQSADEPHVSQQFDIWTVAVEHDASGPRAGKPEPFLQTPANERAPVLSPDGRWIAYESNESGRSQVYVRPFPESGAKNQISIDTGQIPQWARNGRELFFRNEDGTQILVAAYTVKGRTFVAEKPRVWSDKAFANPRSGRNYDLAPDGKRMVAIISDEPQSRHHVTFVENFFDELRRKVPAR
jgi:serine/threonine-protein kinase